MKTSRRTVLKILGASGLTPSMALQAFDIKNNMARRIIPSTGELLPVIGLGTSRVFDANLNEKSLNPRKKIVKALLDHGGSLIDTSPMYGKAEEVTGKIAQDLKVNDHFRSNAFSQIEKIISKERIDFAQFNYSLQEREAEKRLLPLCQEKGVATLINRPFMRGKLFKAVARKKIPGWAYEYNINTWAQFFLKFILANPAVTNIIPATSDPTHMVDNLNGGVGLIPEMGLQKKMVEVVED